MVATVARRPDPRIEDSRKRVLDAAFDVIAEHGFDGATLERIAERSGVSRTTIYRRWPDPSQIYLDALHPLGSWPKVAPSGDLRADLEAHLLGTAHHLNDPRYLAVVLGVIERCLREPEYAQRFRAVREDSIRPLVELLEDGVATGVLRPDVDVSFEALRLLSPLVFRRAVQQELIEADLVAHILDGVLEQIVQPRPGRHRTARSTRAVRARS
jgi:AcrR family transcriptional regulator